MWKPHKPLKLPHHIDRHLFCGPCGQQALHMRLHQIKEQALLVGSIIIKRPGLHPDRARNLAHGHRSIAVTGEQLLRRRADAGAGEFGMRTLAYVP